MVLGRDRRLSKARGMAAWLVLEYGKGTLGELSRRTGRDVTTLSSAAKRLQIRSQTVVENWPFGPRNSKLNLSPLFKFPYDSKYWETNFKASAGATCDRTKLEVNVAGRGGFIWGGDNQLDFRFSDLSTPGSAKMDGDVKGWKLGGDLLARYLPRNSLSFPFGIKTEYMRKTRDGDGIGVGEFQGDVFDYNLFNTRFSVEAGGGFDLKTPVSIRIGAGAFYGYTREKEDFSVRQFTMPNAFVESILRNYPDHTEHRITGKL